MSEINQIESGISAAIQALTKKADIYLGLCAYTLSRIYKEIFATGHRSAPTAEKRSSNPEVFKV